jgi:hypothetical protein
VELYDGVEIVDSYPALYIRAIDTIVISDLHLGYESIASESGVLLPKVQLEETMEKMESILKVRRSGKIIICGDLKHEFSDTTYHEYREVSDFLDFLQGRFDKIVLIKGNHDTFIGRIARRKSVEVYDRYFNGRFLFTHGDKDIVLGFKEDFLVMGHEHPSIVLYGSVSREKVKCFLYGEHEGKRIIVLPAFSYFASGSDVNVIPESELLSPLLKRTGIGSFRAVGVIDGEALLPFPEVDRLKVF